MDSNDSDASSTVSIEVNAWSDQIHRHLEGRHDAVSNGRITNKTRLVRLFDHKSDSSLLATDPLLRDCVDTFIPAQRCQLLDAADQKYPADKNFNDSEYYLYHTYDNMMMAPTARLICKFVKDKKSTSLPYLTLEIDWHFNDFRGDDTGIRDYQIKSVGTSSTSKLLSFTARGASCSGFNLISRVETNFGDEEKRIVALLRSFITPAERQDIQISLDDDNLTSGDRERLWRLRERLPGGSGTLLPSIGMPEYYPIAGRNKQVVAVKKYKNDVLLPIGPMLAGKFKHPLVAFNSKDVYASITEWGARTMQAVVIQDEESTESLLKWAAVQHNGRLYGFEKQAILGVKFQEYKSLYGPKGRYKLPRELSVGLKFPFAGSKTVFCQCEAFLVMNTYGLPHHDAFFRITSHQLTAFGKMPMDPKTKCNDGNAFKVRLTPHINTFTTQTMMATIADVQRCSRWHTILLNQAHDALKNIDMTGGCGIDAELLQKAGEWLRNWVKWNIEQLKVIDGIHCAKGRMMIIMGPAGTGKTLLLRALTRYFHMLGLHVGYFAPANSNVSTFAMQLKEDMSEDPNLNVLRIHPPSKDIDIEKLSVVQARSKRVGHTNGEVCSFEELTIAMESMRTGDASAAVPTVEAAVLKAAGEQKLRLDFRFKDKDESDVGKPDTKVKLEDAWDVFRKYMQDQQSGDLKFWISKKEDSPESKKQVEEHNIRVTKAKAKAHMAYRACKRQIIGQCRFIITTLGNVRCAELMESWLPNDEPDVPRKGMIIIVDEAPKDIEAMTWGPIVCPRWSAYVKGVIMAGDDRQLPPVVTSGVFPYQYNPFRADLETPFVVRLRRQGWPVLLLLEQMRMNKNISAFPNMHFYNGLLRDGPGTSVSLDSVLPGFADVLRDILTYREYNAEQLKLAKAALSDAKLRLRWIEVRGERLFNEHTKSLSVEEHTDVVMERMLPKFRRYFKINGKRKMADHVMIICAYGDQHKEYRRKTEWWIRDNHLQSDDAPRILTVDSSQGQEADMVIFDGSCQHNDRIGFMEDPRRCNVAVTRAKHCLWIIGGGMAMGSKKSTKFHLTQYKEKCDAEGRTTPMG